MRAGIEVLADIIGRRTPGRWTADPDEGYVFAEAYGDSPLAEMRGVGAGLDVAANTRFVATMGSCGDEILRLLRAAYALPDQHMRDCAASSGGCTCGAVDLAVARKRLDVRLRGVLLP